MRSSLASKATQSISQLRNQTTADGWAGEAVEQLVTIAEDVPCRIEWAEGSSPDWDVWVFPEDVDIQAHDILIATHIGKALVVKRSSPWYDLKGAFHHYEVTTTEHEHSIAELTNV